MASPLCFPDQHCRKQGGKHGCALWYPPRKLLQEAPGISIHCYRTLLVFTGKWWEMAEQAGPNLQQFRTSQGIPVNNSFFKLGKIWSQYPNFSWSVSRMRNHTEHFSNFLKGHPPLGIFIWINKMKRNLYYSFPFFSPHKHCTTQRTGNCLQLLVPTQLLQDSRVKIWCN